jgi:hypothetical protein
LFPFHHHVGGLPAQAISMFCTTRSKLSRIADVSGMGADEM